MKRRLPLILFVLMMFAISACNPFEAEQIRAQAEADQIAAQTTMDTLSQEQERQQAADLHAIRMQDAQREQARLDAVEQDVRSGWRIMIQSAFYTGTAVLIFAMFMVGRNTVVQINRLQEGFATAMITAADVRSRLIYLDVNTRQYPLIYQYNGRGRYLVTDPNTKITMELDTRNEGDAQMIAGAIAIRDTGVLAMEQRKSGAKDAASMSLVNPPIIEGSAIDVKTVARDLLKKEVQYE